MIIANRTSHAVRVQLPYTRQYLDGAPESDYLLIQVDDGPNVQARAEAILREQLECYHERDRRYSYSEGAPEGMA